MRIALLGPLRVADGDRDLLPTRPKQRALLVVLALHANQVVSVDDLVVALWGERAPSSAVNALQGHVSSLRKLLGRDRIETHPIGYRLRLGREELDVAEFEALLHAACAAGEPRRRAELAARALAQFEGEPLVDFRFEPFAAPEIGRLEELWLTAKEEAIAAELELGRHDELVPELQGLVAAHPLRERLRSHLMLALYRAGRQAEALEAYRDARGMFSDELGLEPAPELQALQRAILVQDAALAPPLPPAEGNLPAPVDSFIGREPELRRLNGWFGGAVRLATLTGPGGSGKSRLALEAARGLAPAFADGAFVVELAPLRDPSLVIAAIAQALAVPDSGGVLIDRVVARLSSTRTLLLLDNFEHVASAAPEIACLLSGCPDVRVMVTSRVPLHLRGEHELEVAPLDPEDASRLFVERAHEVRPNLTLSEDNGRVVGEISRRLDRLPLAIELAAANVRHMSLEAILEHLRRPLDLPARGAVDLPGRQRTLRDAIQWSHELLGDRERVLLRRLAVFRGGCSLLAAQTVCGLGPETLAAAGALVEHSLLKASSDATGQLRFEMLETVREFAHEQVVESGELADLERVHARYYVSLAEALGPDLQGSEERVAAAFEQLTLEIDNLRAVHEWSLANDTAQTGMQLLATVWLWYWTWLGEALESATRLLQLPSGAPPSDARAGALFVASLFSWALGDLEDTRRYGEQAVETSRTIANDHRLALSLSLLAAGYQHDPAHGYALYDEAKRAAVKTRDGWLIAFVTTAHALFAILVGDPARARQEGEDAAARFRALDAPRQLLLAQTAIGLSMLQLGEIEHSHRLLEETLIEFVRIQNWKLADMCALGVALGARLKGDVPTAKRFYEEALSIAERAGDPSNIPLCLEGLAAVHAHYDPRQATRLLGAARAAFDSGRAPTLPGFEPLFQQTSEQLAAALGPEFSALCRDGLATRVTYPFVANSARS